MTTLLVGFLLMSSAMACMAIGLALRGRPLRRGCANTIRAGTACGDCDRPSTERN